MKLFNHKSLQASTNVEPAHLSPQENLRKTSNVLRLTLTLLGRFPFALRENPDGTATYTFKPFSLTGIYFLYTVASSVVALTFTLTGFLGVTIAGRSELLPNETSATELTTIVSDEVSTVNSTSTAGDDEMSEDDTIEKSFFTCVVLTSVLANATTSLLSALVFGKGFASYLSLWSRRVMQMELDMAEGLRKKLIKQVMIFNTLLTMLGLLVALKVPSGVRETFEALLLINLRSFPQSIRHHLYPTYYPFIRGVAVIALWGYKIFIVFYEFFCSLLKKGFSLWNQRLEAALEHGFGQPNKKTADGRIRSSYEELYTDHYRLVKLVDMTNILFKPALLVYYSTQIVVLCFMCFYMVHTAKDSPGSIATCVVVLAQSFALVYSISLRGSYVFEEAHTGFEIIRKYGGPKARSEEELLFLESLSISYLGETIQLTGGKYFGIDRPFMQEMAGTVVTYFIIIIQFYA